MHGQSWLAVEQTASVPSSFFTSHAQPEPKRVAAALANCFLERVERAEGLVDGRGEIAGGSVGAAGSDDFPEKRVVGVAAAVVADRGADVLRHRGEVAEKLAERLVLKVRLAGDARCSGW